MRQLLPSAGGLLRGDPWAEAYAELDARTLDVAIAPFSDIPARFVTQTLYDESFVIASRPDHPFAQSPGLDTFCAAQHVLVSQSGDSYGFVDKMLAEKGRSRRVALTVPNFMQALAVIGETDLIGAIPRHFLALHAKRFDLAMTEPPLDLSSDPLQIAVSRAAMMDAGIAWLFGVLNDTKPAAKSRTERKSSRRRRPAAPNRSR
jgi:DNA-binding transcriptional LysR family regulator